MKRLTVLVLMLLIAVPSMAAILEWDAPTTYTDNTVIAPVDIARIVYKPYYGTTQVGPWLMGATTADGVLTATLPEPAAGVTLWYTVEATLDGQTSAKAGAVSKTIPFQAPKTPGGLRVR